MDDELRTMTVVESRELAGGGSRSGDRAQVPRRHISASSIMSQGDVEAAVVVPRHSFSPPRRTMATAPESWMIEE